MPKKIGIMTLNIRDLKNNVISKKEEPATWVPYTGKIYLDKKVIGCGARPHLALRASMAWAKKNKNFLQLSPDASDKIFYNIRHNKQ